MRLALAAYALANVVSFSVFCSGSNTPGDVSNISDDPDRLHPVSFADKGERMRLKFIKYAFMLSHNAI